MKKEIHPELKEVKRSEEKPLAAMFAVTYRCQCSCKHCGSAHLLRKDQKEVTTKEAKDIIHQIAGVGAESITFFGGEPLLRKDLPELIKCCSESAMGSRVETNA